MATVPQTLSSSVVFRNWKRPPDPYEGPIPFSEVICKNADTILALDAADVGVYSWSTVLPRGYVYRLVEHRLQLAATAENQLDDMQAGMEWVFTENQVTSKRFMTTNAVQFYSAEIGFAGYQTRNPAITNDFTTEYMIMNPIGMGTDLVDASQGQSIMLGVLVNSAGAGTVAIGTDFYARFLAYTIAQFNAGAIWTPMPVVS